MNRVDLLRRAVLFDISARREDSKYRHVSWNSSKFLRDTLGIEFRARFVRRRTGLAYGRGIMRMLVTQINRYLARVSLNQLNYSVKSLRRRTMMTFPTPVSPGRKWVTPFQSSEWKVSKDGINLRVQKQSANLRKRIFSGKYRASRAQVI